MAFSVAPTSGPEPYILSAVFEHPQLIDGLVYKINVGYITTVGSCPTSGNFQNLSAAQVNTLLTSGSVSHYQTVASGSCRNYTLTISRVSDNTVIASSTVFVDNV